MRVDQVRMRMVRARLTRPFENRWQRFETWTKLVVQVDSDGLSGLGECTAMETPFYNYETVETAWHILERYLAPIVLAAPDTDPLTAASAWRHINGHEEAKAALECALWDLRARAAGLPLCQELGGRRVSVPVAATVGIEPSIDELLAAVGAARDAGFRRVRIKIRPGWDVVPVREVRAAFPELPLIADANAAYGSGDLDHVSTLDKFGPLAIEQPFGSTDLETTADLQRRLATSVCLDESVKGLADVERAHRMRACRVVNIKVGRVGGLAEAVRVHDFCLDNGIATFVGAKYEIGVGRLTNLALATLPNMTLPSDVGPSSRYYVDDGVDHGVTLARPGWVEPSAAPGIGACLTDGVTTIRETVLRARTAPCR
ncbi:O-succinylbenzoate synthase [Alloactinosynnema sp. L-07]|uniref:o-succinylbenzoate synthase n=1 Tax=Alloactinosynnema sp. L-07 TaxID=1653480 RepID=UPI00065F07B2|nr:o-succinylbenzoate synthase [Alloactinosynnema sp. L-07]CRK57283.1 O-succinylbenzoate synthase [Alloactinosynnema sp. L-07]